MIDSKPIANFAQLHELIKNFTHDHRWRYRGESDASRPLVPKIGRPEFALSKERTTFDAWKRRAVAHVPFRPETDWEWLAIAQHHGLATRLSDWTFHILAAVYFAVENTAKHGVDGVLYVFRPTDEITMEDDPFAFEGVRLFQPSFCVPRITHQEGLFLIHGEPQLPLDEHLKAQGKSDDLIKIIIDKSYKDELVFELSQLGVNRAQLFPDLDGLSSHLNWVSKNLNRLER